MTAKERLQAEDRRTLAALCGGQVMELGDTVPEDAPLLPLTLGEDEGRRIYERSLRFVLLLALRQLFPGQQVRIEYSIGHGVFVRLPGVMLAEGDLDRIRREMQSIIAADLPFEKKTWALHDAISYFRSEGQEDKVALLACRPYDYFTMYRCGDMWEYFYGAMVPSTGYVPVFDLHPYQGGLVLMLPTAASPAAPAAYVPMPKHLQVFSQSARWCEILGVLNAADVTALARESRMRAFIRVNEALHDKAIAAIADSIVQGGKRIVLVAGPSSSGKTTFAGRLRIHLQVLGCHARIISLDNYYRNRCELPLQPDGTYDLEALDTIDVPLFRQQVASLLQGQEVELPAFDFVTARRKPQGTPLRLLEKDVLIIEGIHALNPALSHGLPQAALHRVFVSALTCINLDDHNRIRTTDVRLLRRIVRDHQFRGTLPAETLAMWNSVRRGEEKWIFPYQEQADSMFNTALHYELPILKHYASALLEAIPPGDAQYHVARRLCKTLHYFPAINPEILDEIPPLSLLREFIGGCTIDKV